MNDHCGVGAIFDDWYLAQGPDEGSHRKGATRSDCAGPQAKTKGLTMDDYERVVRQIEPSMSLVHASATTRTFCSEQPVQCVQRLRRIDGSVVETRTEKTICAQIQACRAGVKVRWFYLLE